MKSQRSRFPIPLKLSMSNYGANLKQLCRIHIMYRRKGGLTFSLRWDFGVTILVLSSENQHAKPLFSKGRIKLSG